MARRLQAQPSRWGGLVIFMWAAYGRVTTNTSRLLCTCGALCILIHTVPPPPSPKRGGMKVKNRSSVEFYVAMRSRVQTWLGAKATRALRLSMQPVPQLNFIFIKNYFNILHVTLGARCSVVGWGAMLQIIRLWLRIPKTTLDFSIYQILPAAIWSCGLLNL
jgi:hypothetical protein